jgi:hypothetical protein
MEEKCLGLVRRKRLGMTPEIQTDLAFALQTLASYSLQPGFFEDSAPSIMESMLSLKHVFESHARGERAE